MELSFFFDQVLLNPLDLRVELFLLQSKALRHVLILLLVHGIVDGTLQLPEETIVLGFLISFLFKCENFCAQFFNCDQVLLDLSFFLLQGFPGFFDSGLQLLSSFIDDSLEISLTLADEKRCLVSRCLTVLLVKERILSSIKPHRLLALGASSVPVD